MLWGAAQRMTGEVACPPFRRRVETTATRRAASLLRRHCTTPGRGPCVGVRRVLGRAPALVDVCCYSGSLPLAPVMLTRGRLLRLPLGTRFDPLPGGSRL